MSANTIALADDDGMVTIEIAGQSPVTVDLYEAHDNLAALIRQHGTEPAAYYVAARKYLASIGLPELSARRITQLSNAIFDRVAELKKSDQPTPSSESPA